MSKDPTADGSDINDSSGLVNAAGSSPKSNTPSRTVSALESPRIICLDKNIGKPKKTEYPPVAKHTLADHQQDKLRRSQRLKQLLKVVEEKAGKLEF